MFFSQSADETQETKIFSPSARLKAGHRFITPSHKLALMQ